MKKAILLVLVLISGSAVYAQDCSTGTCSKPVRNVAHAVATPVANVAEATVDFAVRATHEVACTTKNVVRTASCVATSTVSHAVNTVRRPLLRSRRCCK
jgi:hypothetical protein